ncbi:MAG: hypothetical protein HFH14_03060 [Lachnospiraceae bacterium]|nr:hypothetical protein [Lachnospiraceae bacterium]
MAFSIDNTYMSLNSGINSSSNISSERLSKNIENISSQTDDKELLDACKGFEQYFVEQVMKEFTKSLEEFNGNSYMQCFGDTLISEYAGKVTDSGTLGLAQMLYDSMKSRGI